MFFFLLLLSLCVVELGWCFVGKNDWKGKEKERRRNGFFVFDEGIAGLVLLEKEL